MIDILNIQPSVISKDLRGKYVLLYGKPKSGKTTAACSFPNSLLVAFERGYNAIGGVRAADVTKWADFKQVLRQLEKPEAQKLYETVIIDTISIAWDYCEQYVCAQNGVQKIGDIPWGGGYSACKKEFESALRKITMLGYGIVLIAHSAARTEKTAEGSEIEIISPDMPKRAAEICNGLVDIIGYIGGEYDENKVYKRYLYTRETPTLFAGSRFKYLAAKIPFGYKYLEDAIVRAIDAEVSAGATVTTEAPKKEENRPFEETVAEGRALWTELIKKDEKNAEKIMKYVTQIFGHPIKLSEITEDQQDLFELTIAEMKSL